MCAKSNGKYLYLTFNSYNILILIFAFVLEENVKHCSVEPCKPESEGKLIFCSC